MKSLIPSVRSPIIYNSNKCKCINYRIFKNSLCFEKYLNTLPNKLSVIKFQTRNHKLPDETDSYCTEERELNKLNKRYVIKKIGDEFHYLFVWQPHSYFLYKLEDLFDGLITSRILHLDYVRKGSNNVHVCCTIVDLFCK